MREEKRQGQQNKKKERIGAKNFFSSIVVEKLLLCCKHFHLVMSACKLCNNLINIQIIWKLHAVHHK